MKPATDEKGKKHFDYFIHFQGWNSSWDRDVDENLLLKDNEENRREQTALYQQTDEYRQRMERKKKRKLSDKIRTSTESNIGTWTPDTGGDITTSARARHSTASLDGGAYSPEEADTHYQRYSGRRSFTREHREDEADQSVNGEDDEGVEVEEEEEEMEQEGQQEHGDENLEDETGSPDRGEDAVEVPVINLPDTLKERLEGDMRSIRDGKMVRLPAQPNIVSLLEGFVRSFAISKLSNLEKINQKLQHKSQYRPTANSDKSEADRFEEVLNAIKISKEVAEGVRILIDFHLGNVLLYPQEREQFRQSSTIRPHMEIMERLVAAPQAPTVAPPPGAAATSTAAARSRKSTGAASSCDSIEEASVSAAAAAAKRNRGNSGARKKESECDGGGGGGIAQAKTQGSVGSAASVSSGTATPVHQGNVVSTPQVQYPQSKKSHQVLHELYSWKLVPEPVYFEEPVPASLVYGGIHLVRLMVRIPDIFARMRFTSAKLKLVLKYIDALVDYLNNQPDLFSDSCYSREKVA